MNKYTLQFPLPHSTPGSEKQLSCDKICARHALLIIKHKCGREETLQPVITFHRGKGRRRAGCPFTRQLRWGGNGGGDVRNITKVGGGGALSDKSALKMVGGMLCGALLHLERCAARHCHISGTPPPPPPPPVLQFKVMQST